ncbi:MAG TPA: ATP-binding protein [Kofleriaceae bacterium]|jgi:two-component system phosphate regulon sensor histidine kinase PhoR
MRSSLRNRLLALFLVLVVVVGVGTLYAIERSLASDLLTALDARLSAQGRAVAGWLTNSGDPARLATRLAAVTGTRITVIGADGLVEGDSLEPSTVGSPIGDAPEVAIARRGELNHAVRELRADEPRQYLVAVPDDEGRVIRLAVPLGDIIDTRARMRNRLLVGFGFGFLGALFLSWIFVRAITRPIQSMTLTAERLAAGDYETANPSLATAAGGEFAVLARAMMRMAGEVKAREGELRQERDLLSVVFASLVEGVIVVEKTGAIALANAAAKPLIGDDGLPVELGGLVERARYGGVADAEVELVGRAVRATARQLEGGAVIVVLSDVTRIRSLEAVRREFLSNAAHELRTPVTSISGYAETLLGGSVDGETSKEFLSTIHRNAQRISSLVADLVLLDQLGGRDAAVVNRASVPLAQVVDDAARTTKGIAPAAQIEVDVAAELAVLGTREGLDHVVQNLVDNAVKYGGGTPVTVRASRVGPHVRLAVADAGPGIPKGFEERVFERFYRVDPGRSRAQGGSGLGLAIVKSQLEAMGGRVWLEHAEPGARFVIELDAA